MGLVPIFWEHWVPELPSPSLQILKMWLGLKRFVDQASASPTPMLPLFLVTLRREFG